MNIAHFGVYKPESSNGANRAVAGLAKGQRELGNNVYVYSLDLDSEEIVKETRDGINIVHFPKLKMKGFKLPPIFKDYIRKNPDNIHIFHLHSVYMPENVVLSQNLTIPYVLTPHGGYSPMSRKRSIASFIKKSIFDLLFEKRMLKKAAAIQALTEDEHMHIKKLTKHGNIFIVPNGVEIPEIKISNITDSKSKKSEYGDYIVYCGRLDIKCKGIDLLLKAFALTVERNWIKGLKLVLIGPGTNACIKKINKMINKYELTDKVVLTGALHGEEKNNLIANSKFYIQCSRWDGFSLSVAEAAVLGKPVVITEGIGFKYWIKKYKCGIVAKATPEHISAAIKAMYHYTESHRFNLEIKSRVQKLANELSWKVIAEKIVSKYSSILKVRLYTGN